MQATRATTVAYDSRKQKAYHVIWPLVDVSLIIHYWLYQTPAFLHNSLFP